MRPADGSTPSGGPHVGPDVDGGGWRWDVEPNSPPSDDHAPMPDAVASTDAAGWSLIEDGFAKARASYYETVMTVGNGRLGTRASLEEGHLGARSGMFIAGVYDAHDAAVTDLVNAPDWLDCEVWVDGYRLDVDTLDVMQHRRTLHLDTGVLNRATTFEHPTAGRVRLGSSRLASMADRDLCAQRVEVTALDSPARVTITTGIDAERDNLESLPAYARPPQLPPEHRWSKWSRSHHLQVLDRHVGVRSGLVCTRTVESGVTIATAFQIRPSDQPTEESPVITHSRVATRLVFDVEPGVPIGVDKQVTYATSRDPLAAATHPRIRALETLARHAKRSFDDLAAASARVWAELWADSEVTVEGHEKDQLALRLAVYHLLIAANPEDATVSIGAKSLSGEGYRGHVFWDSEILLLPFYLYTQPKAARALLSYRHHTLPGARAHSAAEGTRGARYPWESAGTGAEECPRWTPDGQNRFWTRDEELHVTADVAYGLMHYDAATGDDTLLMEAGAQVLFETSRFWISRLEERDDGTLSLSRVMGPDEFHSHVTDNAFTNRMVRWHLEQAVAVYQRLSADHPDRLSTIAELADLEVGEVEQWAAAAPLIRVPGDDSNGVIEQFEGYFDRTPLSISTFDDNDMPQYPPGYHHFNLEDTDLLKQPDVVMLMFMLADAYSLETQRVNLAYYESKTLHKSSLSPPIHAIVGLRVGDAHLAARYFERSAYVDLDDNQGNTQEGMHIAAAGGTWQVTVHGFGGMQLHHGDLTFHPALPERWQRLAFTTAWRGRRIHADLTHGGHTFTLLPDGNSTPVDITDGGRTATLHPGVPVTVPTE